MNKKKLLAYLLLSSFSLAEIAEAKTVKIMYAYTKSTKNLHGGSKKVKAKLVNQFRSAKKLFVSNNRKSGIKLIAGPKYQTSYDSGTSSLQHIYRLSKKAKVKKKFVMGDIRRKRDKSKSDLVQLYATFSDVGSLSGRGDLGGPYSVVERQALGLYYGVADIGNHELGHNFNATHSQGFCLSGNKYRTAVEVGCFKSRRAIEYFSHPSFKKGKQRLGKKGKDNRRRVIKHQGTVSRFR